MRSGFNYYRALKTDREIVEPLRGTKFKMPVMAITGQYGVGEKLADALNDECPTLRRFIVPDSGHFPHEESEPIFCKNIRDFLAE